MNAEHNKYNVADYISEFLVALRCYNVHGLMGGGAAGLNDGFIRNSKIDYFCYHHEQSAGYAAIGEARSTKRWAILNPTTGCGGTNCYTPVVNAWHDSIPLVVISGNVNLSTCASYFSARHNVDLRCYGVQEHNIVKSVESVTKYAKVVENSDEIESVLIEAFCTAATGRRGPVWIDVPADVQHQNVSEKLMGSLQSAVLTLMRKIDELDNQADIYNLDKKTLTSIRSAKRPLILLGGGISNNVLEKKVVLDFLNANKIPVVTTYAATDVITHDYDYFLGTIGIKGNRAANFAIQNCDLVIVLGSRLPFAAIGYDVGNFAQHAQLIVVEVDHEEIHKNKLNFDEKIIQINTRASKFLQDIQHIKIDSSSSWLQKCKDTKSTWNIIKENKKHYNYEGISIYHVMEELNKSDYDNSNFVVDAGSISYVAPTALRYNYSRKFIFSPGQADMGCALPSALGVSAISDNHTYCITGDGSFMSNLQELATFSHHNYNLSVIILNNSGYLSISNTQRNNYGDNRVYGEHQGRGLTFPSYAKLCDAFNLSYKMISDINELPELENRDINVFEIRCLDEETIAPYQARVNGEQAGAHDMAPFLDKEELIAAASIPLTFNR